MKNTIKIAILTSMFAVQLNAVATKVHSDAIVVEHDTKSVKAVSVASLVGKVTAPFLYAIFASIIYNINEKNFALPGAEHVPYVKDFEKNNTSMVYAAKAVRTLGVLGLLTMAVSSTSEAVQAIKNWKNGTTVVKIKK